MEQISVISKTYAQNQYLNYLLDPNFQGVKRLFVLSFQKKNGRTSHSEYYLPKVKIKGYNVKVDGKKFVDQLMNNDPKSYEHIRKIATGQGNDYTTSFFLDYSFFKENYKMIAIDSSK